jgi:hypothetical protein
MAGKPIQQVVNFMAGDVGELAGGCALGVEVKDSASFQYVFSYSEADSGLLFVAQQGKVDVEEVMGLIAFAVGGQRDQFDQAVGEAVSGHGAVGSARRPGVGLPLYLSRGIAASEVARAVRVSSAIMMRQRCRPAMETGN